MQKKESINHPADQYTKKTLNPKCRAFTVKPAFISNVPHIPAQPTVSISFTSGWTKKPVVYKQLQHSSYVN